MNKKKLREILTGLGFLSPNILGFMIFMVFPVMFTLYLSFHRWDMFSAPQYQGLENYRLLLQDPWFWQSLGNTIIFVVVTVPVSMILAFFLAVFLNEKLKGVTIYRTAFFMPVVASLVAISLVWRWLYNPDFGLINMIGLAILNFFINILNGIAGIFGANPIPRAAEGVNWLGSTTWALPAIIAVSVWKTVGYNMVIFLAGLQGIPEVFYESAEIDGAGWWTKLTKITIPMLQATTFFVLVTSLIRAFQIFVEVYIMTEGGPGGETSTLVFYLYANAFRWFKMGYACTIAWGLVIIVFIITIFQWKTVSRGEELY